VNVNVCEKNNNTAGPAKVATLEHCLVVGGNERVRLQLLLETRGGRREELDVQVRWTSW
jgi:hypothetical protein